MAESTVSARPFRAFATPAYTALLAGAFISNVGTWMERIAVGVYVAEETGKAGWTGAVTAVLFLPSTLIAPLGGTLADRFERRRYLAVVTIVLTVLAGTLCALSIAHHLSIAVLLILMTLTGCASSFMSPAFTALLSDVVPREDLTSAIFLNSGQWNLARVIGPVLAAWIMAAGGVSWAFALNTISFLAVLVALWMAGEVPQQFHVGESVWQGLRAAARVVQEDNVIFVALALVGATGVLIAPFIGLAPAFAVTVLGSGAIGTSWLVACHGLGAVVSSVVASTWADRIGQRRWLLGAATALGPLAALYWMCTHQAAAQTAILILGACYLAVVTGSSNLILGRAPLAARARVQSLYNMLLDGGYAVGLIVVGSAGDAFGLQRVAVTACVGFTAIVFLGRRYAAGFSTEESLRST